MRVLIATGRLAALAAFLAAFLAASAGLWQTAGAAEETKIAAFSVWQGQGYTYSTGVQQGTFLGTFAGTVYVLTDQGPQLSGDLVCPAVITFDLTDKGQTGKARCTIFRPWRCRCARKKKKRTLKIPRGWPAPPRK